LANLLDGLLHLLFELVEPFFNLTFSLDTLIEVNVFGDTLEMLVNSDDKTAVLFVKSNGVDSVEKLFEIVLDSVGVGTLRQNLEQISVGAEVEAGENTSLLFEVRVKLLLALLEIVLHGAEGALKEFILAARNDVLSLEGTLHVLEPNLVNLLEKLGFGWQVSCDITGGEDGNEIGPEGLYLQPFLNHISHIGKQSNSVSDLSLEGGDVLHGVHLIKLVKMFLKLLLDIQNVTTESAWGINTLPGLDLKLSFLPMRDNLTFEGVLKLELFVSRLSDFLDFLTELEKGALEELLQGEGLTLVRNILLNELDNVVPMPVADRWLGKGSNEGKDLSHVVNLLLQFTVGLPRFKGAWQFAAISGELIDSLNHFVNFVDNFCPWNFTPLGDGVLDLTVEGVKFIKELNLIGGLDQHGVLGVGETKEGLTSVERVKLTLSDRVLIRELTETVKSLTGFEAWYSWALGLEVVAEILDVNDQRLNSLDEVILEVSILA
jgi:hypothetical protein